MYLFYIDESGNTGFDLRSPDQPVHWLVAIGATPAQIKRVESDIRAIGFDSFGAASLEPGFEFKGSALFRGDRSCTDLSTSERVQIYQRLLRLIGEHEMTLFVRGIDKTRYAERFSGDVPEHPHQRCFQYLLESIDRWLQERQPEPGSVDPFDSEPCYGLIVADEQREMARALVESFAQWRSTGTASGYKPRTIRFLVDTVHYVPSQDSRMIQLADCVAFVRGRYEKVRRMEEAPETLANRAIREMWETLCRPHTHEDRVWPL